MRVLKINLKTIVSKNVYLENQNPVELVYYILGKVNYFLVLRSHCSWLVGFCLVLFCSSRRSSQVFGIHSRLYTQES